jgi:hypothetical protein
MIISANDLVADYANVMNRLLKTNLDLTKTIFPIDLGNSWEVVCQTEPVLYEKMKDIMQEIIKRLQEDLLSLDVNELFFSRLTNRTRRK